MGKSNLSNENSEDDKSPDFKKMDRSTLLEEPNKTILKRSLWYKKLKKIPKGTNIYQASIFLGISYTSLKIFLRDLEFCRLVRLRTEFHNGRKNKIIIIEDFMEEGGEKTYG